MDILDLRNIADQWQEIIDDCAYDEARNEAEECAPYIALAEALGVDIDPSALRSYGDNIEPTIIAASDFEEYAQELAKDIGAISGDSQWPLYCIDWEFAARELSSDYTTVTFDGTDYYIRSW